MKSSCKMNRLILFGAMIVIFLGTTPVIRAQDSRSRVHGTDGLHLELTKEFYESLLAKEQRGDRLYSNDPSTEYLKEISISMRFMVETNLQILKQQERILQLLQSVLEDKTK